MDFLVEKIVVVSDFIIEGASGGDDLIFENVEWGLLVPFEVITLLLEILLPPWVRELFNEFCL